MTQAWVLWRQRWTLFFREMNQVWLQVSLLFIFPGLVVLFALDGLPQIPNLSMETGDNVLRELRERLEFFSEISRVGGLVSGLIMFQVILLTLMGSNNSAREVVAERTIFEKEKLAGLRASSYLAAKIGFLTILVAAQSVWMCLFVKFVCGFPGDLHTQLLFLFLANAAMTSICLAVSSWSRTTEQASLISIYLVGFQLPLSGAILALPEPLGAMVRPFIAAYWSWSGLLGTLRETRFYDAAIQVTTTPVADPQLCLWVLVTQVLAGIILAWFGLSRSRWDG
ncbi:MAG: ABC transporter permease [Verrucomicrobiia bacterium]